MTDQTENPRYTLKRLLVSEFDVPNPSMIRDTIADRFVLIDRNTLPEHKVRAETIHPSDLPNAIDEHWKAARENIANALAIEAHYREQAEKEAALDRALDDEAFALATAGINWSPKDRDGFFDYAPRVKSWRAVAQKARAMRSPQPPGPDEEQADENGVVWVGDPVPGAFDDQPDDEIGAASLNFRRVVLARYLLGLPDNTTVSFYALQDSTKKAIDRIIQLEDRANKAGNAGVDAGQLATLLDHVEKTAHGLDETYRRGVSAACVAVRGGFGLPFGA